MSVALGIQHAKHKRRILLTYVACVVVQYFSTLCHKQSDFQENILMLNTCYLNFILN